MADLEETFGGRENGELIRAQDWNDLIAAIDGHFRRLQDEMTERFATLDAAVGDIGDRVGLLENRVGPLEALAGVLRSRYRRLDLSAPTTTFAIGQRGEIVARVTDIEGQPLASVPAAQRPWVDFVTVWGSLKAAPGFTSRGGAGGQTVTVRTDENGEARVLLRAEPGEVLAEEQEQEVEAVLATTVGQRTVASTILAAATPDSTQVRNAFQAVTRAYTRTDTRVMESFLDTYYVRRPPMVAGPVRVINWQDHDATVMAFVKADDSATSADGAMASGTIRVTFRDWVRPWIVGDFAIPPVTLVDDYRNRFGALIGTDYGVAVNDIFDLVQTDARDLGLIGRARQYAAAQQAMDGLIIDDGPAFAADLKAVAAGAFGLQQGLLYGQAAAPVPLTGVEAGKAMGLAGAQGQVAAERAAAQTRAETRVEIDAAEGRIGQAVLAQTEEIGSSVGQIRQLAEAADLQARDAINQLGSKAGVDVVSQLLNLRGG